MNLADDHIRLQAAVDNFLDDVFMFAVEDGEKWSCNEINALAALYKIMNRPKQAAIITGPNSSHARDDDEGDDHYVRVVVGTCERCEQDVLREDAEYRGDFMAHKYYCKEAPSGS